MRIIMQGSIIWCDGQLFGFLTIAKKLNSVSQIVCWAGNLFLMIALPSVKRIRLPLQFSSSIYP